MLGTIHNGGTVGSELIDPWANRAEATRPVAFHEYWRSLRFHFEVDHNALGSTPWNEGDVPALRRYLDAVRADLKATAAAEDVAHSADYRSVRWYGQSHSFTGNQAACVKLLWEQWEQGTSDVAQETVIEHADSSSNRLVHVFRGHAAWGTMIVAGKTRGTCRLAKRK